ncbi:MAG: hypothetical protein PF574_08360 [Candidatus Delongbacteria bacterium]|jgi:hypothetical protein|nr:hypothetical protein [Candidatus Delongbacteria bacterium]
MKNKRISIIVMILGFAIPMFSQAINYSGISDIMLAQNDDTVESVETEASTPRIKAKKKAEYKDNMSPMIASGLSLLLPGAGEFYGKDYIRSGIFLGIEAIAVSMWYVYDSDGDDFTSEFKTFADANFSEDRYYGGLMGMSQNFLDYLNNSDWIDASEVWSLDYFSNRDNWTWEEKDSLSVVDILELSFRSDDTDTPEHEGFNGVNINLYNLDNAFKQFTHNLPSTKTQQYYEMVGKYHQFACGWNDFEGYETDDGGNIIYYDDIVQSGDSTITVSRPKLIGDGTVGTTNISFNYSEDGGYNSASHVDFYEDLRNEANIAYEAGQNWLMVTLLNHVASAFDAAYVIKSKYSVETKLRIENNDKADALGIDNYKLTYSINW